MIDMERKAERQIKYPLTTTLAEAFESGANWVLDDIKSEFESLCDGIKNYLTDNDVDEDIENGIEVALNDFKDKLEEYC